MLAAHQLLQLLHQRSLAPKAPVAAAARAHISTAVHIDACDRRDPRDFQVFHSIHLQRWQRRRASTVYVSRMFSLLQT